MRRSPLAPSTSSRAARSKPLPRVRAKPRTHRCQACSARTSSKVCPNCGTRKATKRGNIGKRCDALWAAYVKRDGKCFRCGKTEGLQAAHIIGRAQRVTRWTTTNGVCLCHTCHRLFDTHRIQRAVLIVEAIGIDAAEALYVKAQGVWDKQYPLAELTQLVKEMTKK